jgi:hypothetical protein
VDTRLLVLKLFLDELDTPIDVDADSLPDPRQVQQAVYMGQLTEVDLGYRFGWGPDGPYSPDLEQDYYALVEAIASGDRSYLDQELQQPVRERLRAILPLLRRARQYDLAPDEWLYLVSNLHYLRKVRSYDQSAARADLATRQPRFADLADAAEEQLRRSKLLA